LWSWAPYSGLTAHPLSAGAGWSPSCPPATSWRLQGGQKGCQGDLSKDCPRHRHLGRDLTEIAGLAHI
jgi:hypothetical protein